jgi:hypothetical protein
MRFILALTIVASLLVSCGFGRNSEADKLHDPQAACLTGGHAWDTSRKACITPTPPTPKLTAASTSDPTPTVVTLDAPFGLLASLPVDVAAVLAAGPLLTDTRTFTGYGMPRPGNPDEVSPQWEFAAPPGTLALAPVTGYVVAIETLWSDDFSIWIAADKGHSWVWELEHVVEVQVVIGDLVEAGQPIATASVFGGRDTALVEIGLFQGGQVPTHHCPLLYVDANAMSEINAGLAAIRSENFERLKSQGLIADPENDPNGQACWTNRPVFEHS